MNTTQLKVALRGSNPNFKSADIDAALAKVDQPSVFAKHRARYISKVWDERSPINGVPAEQVLARQDIPKDPNRKILLIYVDGRLARIQPHHPDEAGFVAMTESDLDDANPNSVVHRHLDDLAQREADVEILDTVTAEL